jgi:hypothetical protein
MAGRPFLQQLCWNSGRERQQKRQLEIIGPNVGRTCSRAADRHHRETVSGNDDLAEASPTP